MPLLFHSVEMQEEPLDVAIRTALAHLISHSFDESVVPTLGSHCDLHSGWNLRCAYGSPVGSGIVVAGDLCKAKLREKVVGQLEDSDRVDVASMKVAHGLVQLSVKTVYYFSPLAGNISCIQSSRCSGLVLSR